jgi:VIT1/CCC1 family predicted Fe2+/Mn2+ transporter
MAREQLRQASLAAAFSEVLGDLAELFQKELRLARAELSSNVSAKFRGAIWLGLAILLSLSALALLLGAFVVWITTFGVSLHIAFLIVAAVVVVLTTLVYFIGRNEIQADLIPSRTLSQVKQDIETAKEQLR